MQTLHLAIIAVLLMTLAVISHGQNSKINIKTPKYTCCMPRAHTVHAKVTRMGLSNCNPSNGDCHFDGMKIIREKHMPDFFHRRYRLDLQIEVNGKVVSDETTLGFMDTYPSNFGVEYVFNKTTCSCKQLTRQAAYLMVSCVDADYQLEGHVDIGIKSEDHIKSQKFVRTKQLHSNTTQIDVMVVQPVQTKPQPLPYPDPYPSDYNCAIVYSDTRIESRDTKGQLNNLETISSECWDFLPFNTDSDYVLPSYCPKCH
ncbi:predicted protein [Naegleria gruberi]|uniref:Predicted protein n=1 Tax=Naegleria gruberi TaxID=5762 RepID=D2VW85_NAEGR|nr:uncharacterized protein NAEGRDRAFT_73292 [Naegleria gruberi]EFC38969.1 predicted protein [Naegleria gruberi]|eukprot:XP_002671713.1 predicted protein [Naegleria gruberi strain NEG-M]